MNNRDKNIDPDRNDEEARPLPQENETGPPNARVRRTRWRGWLWAVPLAAAILVVYLVVRTWVLTGPTVTVTFPAAQGLRSKGTPVRHKGVQVGTVDGVHLTEDLSEVVVTLSMKSSVSDFLREGARFWIVSPQLLSGNVSNLISGSYIAMEPGEGEKVESFEGLLRPPTTQPEEPGTAYVLHTRQAEGIHHGAPVLYQGIRAGKVTGVSVAEDPDLVRVDVFVHAPFDRLVQAQSRFWQCGSLNLSPSGSGFGVGLPPLSSLLQGCITFDTFGDAGEPVTDAEDSRADPGAVFRLYGSAAAAQTAFTGQPAAFLVRFPGSVSGLQPEAPVELEGIPVGEVREVSLEYHPDEGTVGTPVIIEIYPDPFGLTSGGTDRVPVSDALYQALGKLVQRGLRAQLTSANLLLGNKKVSLVMTDRPTDVRLDLSGPLPRIPAIAGGDISSVIASIGRITDTVNALPIQQIGQNLRDLSTRLEEVAASPEIRQSIENLNRTLANLEKITSETRGQIEPILQSLREGANAAESAAKTVSNLTGGSLRGQQDIKDLVGELTEAARSVRSLADYLTRHPEAILQGRSSE